MSAKPDDIERTYGIAILERWIRPTMNAVQIDAQITGSKRFRAAQVTARQLASPGYTAWPYYTIGVTIVGATTPEIDAGNGKDTFIMFTSPYVLVFACLPI